MKKRFFKGNFFLKFLCVCAAFVLNIGTMCAGTTYGSVTGAVHYGTADGDAGDGCKIYVSTSNVAIGDITEEQWTDSPDPLDVAGTVTVSQGWWTSYSYSSTNVYLYAQVEEGFEFYGWYASVANEDGWTGSISGYDISLVSTDLQYTYAAQPSSESAESPTALTIYALYGPKRYHGALRVVTADATKGMISRYKQTGTDWWSGEPTYGWGSYTESEQSDTELTIPLSGQSYGITSTKSVRALAVRGYEFAYWSKDANTNYSDSTVSSGAVQVNATVKATSLDPDDPTIGVLTANFKAATPKTITVRKLPNAGTISVQARNVFVNGNTLSTDATSTVANIAKEPTESNVDWYASDSRIILSATAESTHRFLGWYNKDEVLVTTNAKCTLNVAAKDTILEARFEEGYRLYYAATADTTIGGRVQVAFTEEIPNDAPDYKLDSTDIAFATSAQRTAYFKANPRQGYVFVGWKESPAGDVVSYELTYSKTYTVNSTSKNSPTTCVVYAYFEKESDDDARLYSALGDDLGSGSLSSIISRATNGNTIVLLKNVNLGSSAQTISKSISIDFNNYTISGTVNNLITIDGATITVNFNDASDQGNGGVSLSAEANSELIAVYVSRGTLNANKGILSCRNTSTEEGVEAVGVKVATGAIFNLEGATISSESSGQSYGVKVLGNAKFATGSVNANAANNACGLLANGEVRVTWGVAINATTSATNAFGVVIDDADANVTIDGGVITATAGTSNAYAVQVKQSSVSIGGNMAAKATAGTTSTAYALKQQGSALVNVETGRFYTTNTQDMTAATAANLKLYGGYYVHDVPSAYIQSGVTKGELQSGTKFYTEGYHYVLTNGDNPNYVVATANGKKFSSLEDAIIYANNNPNTTMTIRLEVPEYTLPAGNYTIPQKAALLVPYKTGNTTSSATCPNQNQNTVPTKAFAKLIFESGVQMDVYGIIEISGEQNNYATSSEGTGRPRGDYGHLVMKTGSKIVLASGAEFRAWGFVTGDNTKDAQGNYNMGEIDIRRGATVREMFQLYDFKGGWGTANMGDNSHKAFPFHQYFIQNIEVPSTYRPGSSLYGHMAAVQTPLAVKIIGVSTDQAAMFMMKETDDSEDTWVRKSYSINDDRQVYEINNDASISNIYVNLGGMYGSFNSSAYTLPLTNNMRIRLLSGEMKITQDVALLPGAEIEISKKSTVAVDADKTLFLHDSIQWGTYSFSSAFAQRIRYRPYKTPTNTERAINSLAALGDARVNVKGTFDVKGSLCTTEDGARIYSSNSDAGTVKFTTAPTGDKTLGVWTHQTGSSYNTEPHFIDFTCSPAQLRNGDGSYTKTYTDAEHHAEAGDSYCYKDGAWHNFKEDGCFVYEVIENETIYYAKPKDYVKLLSNEEDNETHLYYSKVGGKESGRQFILIGDCEWWEVEDVEENDALKHCVHPDNLNKYYYYDNSNPNPGYHEWKEKHFTVTWVTKPYEELEENQGRVVYPVDYKATPKYLGTNPSRPMTDYYTYDFIGWLPEIVPVTDDAVYVAQFQQNDRKYLITFLDEDGSVLEEALWKMGDIPAPVNEPTPSGKKLVWEPLITAVTGEATYRATYTDIVLPAYQITFVNWDGTPLQQSDVATNTLPEYTGDTPTKPSLADVGFEFEGWTPDLAPVDGEAVYTAKFREKPATYTITFMDATGEGDPIQIGEALTLGYGETPICPAPPTKAPTEEFYYTVIWSPLISAVTGNATYTATGFAAHKNTCRLTVSAGANGQVRMADGEWKNDTTNVFDYGTSKQIEAKATTTGYSFKRWSDGNTQNPRTVTVNAAISLTAEFALNQYEITWKNEGGMLIEKTTVNHGVVPTHVAPTKATDESNTYSFAGWSPTPVAATGTATYMATFNATPIEYTIRIVLNNGMNDIVYEGMHYNDEITIGTPVKASKNGVDYTFSHWTNSADENIGTTIPNVTQNEIYYAQYDTHINDLKAGNSDDANAKDLALTETGMEAQTLTIEATGTVNITGSVTVQNLVVESNGTNSGQLLGTSSARLTINEHAYFDLTLNAQRRTWYAVAVPWAVDCRTGISIKGGRKLVLGRDFDLVYYQGNVRASEGAGYQCWKYAEDPDGDKIMHPGRAYMMYFGSEIETIRFENYDDTPFDDAVLTVGLYDASEAGDANWNGVANPMTYHATLAAGGATYGYYLNNGRVDEYMVGEGEPTYKLVNLASFNAIVGKPLFIQAVNTTPISTTPKIAAAPRRIREIEIEEGIETVYEVTFGAENSTNKDNIFIQTVETKEDGYVIGQDLLKAGYNAKFPQMWVNRYGKRLSVNSTTPENGVHEYPLTLNIPQAGAYTIAIESTQGDTESLYLTKNGSIIWNLSNGAYTDAFEKGESTSYGLRTAAKSPMTPTSVDEAVVDAQGEIKKVIINDKVFIIRGENVYTIDGQLVK